jgi:hypothetical protein
LLIPAHGEHAANHLVSTDEWITEHGIVAFGEKTQLRGHPFDVNNAMNDQLLGLPKDDHIAHLNVRVIVRHQDVITIAQERQHTIPGNRDPMSLVLFFPKLNCCLQRRLQVRWLDGHLFHHPFN